MPSLPTWVWFDYISGFLTEMFNSFLFTFPLWLKTFLAIWLFVFVVVFIFKWVL